MNISFSKILEQGFWSKSGCQVKMSFGQLYFLGQNELLGH